jgi:hypothetical protein
LWWDVRVVSGIGCRQRLEQRKKEKYGLEDSAQCDHRWQVTMNPELKKPVFGVWGNDPRGAVDVDGRAEKHRANLNFCEQRRSDFRVRRPAKATQDDTAAENKNENNLVGHLALESKKSRSAGDISNEVHGSSDGVAGAALDTPRYVPVYSPILLEDVRVVSSRRPAMRESHTGRYEG